MKWEAAQRAVEVLRANGQLWLPPLSVRRGFSSSRVEHLLNLLREMCPLDEDYLEVGTLEGRTLEAAAAGNEGVCIGVDPCIKYSTVPLFEQPNVHFLKKDWRDLTGSDLPRPIGVAFYDADHSASQTAGFLSWVALKMADEAVVVIDDWDREEVRIGVFTALEFDPRWRLLREMPEYTQGPETAPPNHFGYYYGVAVLGFRR